MYTGSVAHLVCRPVYTGWCAKGALLAVGPQGGGIPGLTSQKGVIPGFLEQKGGLPGASTGGLVPSASL